MHLEEKRSAAGLKLLSRQAAAAQHGHSMVTAWSQHGHSMVIHDPDVEHDDVPDEDNVDWIVLAHFQFNAVHVLRVAAVDSMVRVSGEVSRIC